MAATRPAVPGRVVTADPAVETWRETFAAMNAASVDPAVLAVASDARCLLLGLAHMPPSERAAMHEELAAAGPEDVPGLLRTWRVTAGLHASLGTARSQNAPQGDADGSGDARPASDAPGAQRGAGDAHGPLRADARDAHSATDAHSAPEGRAQRPAGSETPEPGSGATEAPAARQDGPDA